MSIGVVGVIGTGAMGLGVVRSLVRHGVPTLTRDVRDEADAGARALGATPMPSSAALAAAVDVTLVLVVDDVQVEDVLFGAQGAATAFRPGSVLVLSSTVDPLYVAALAPRLRRDDVAIVDAPVSGGPSRAADGTMTMMVSGARDALERCAPLFSKLAGRVFVVGDRPGQAATFKIVNNLLAAANLAAGAEALALATCAGIDAKAALEVINASSGASWIVADRMERALEGDHGVRAATRVLAKDVGIAASLSRRLGVHAPCTRTALQVFQEAVRAGFAEADDSSLLELALKRQHPPAG